MARIESCYNCVFARWSPGQWLASLPSGFPVRPMCANQPETPGRWMECPLGRVCNNYRRRPPTPTGETVKTISVGDGFYAYVDAADFEWLNQWVWTLHSGYAVRYEKHKQIYMHREIMKPPKGMVVDHIYRNKLDNTRESLRICTHKENARNRSKPRGSASRFLGVGYDRHRRKWYATVYVEGRQIWLGYFTDEFAAARGYDYAAVERLGEAANLNFPREWPPERIREVYKKPPAKRSRKKSSKRASCTPKKTGGKKSHGQGAHATKRPARKGRRRVVPKRLKQDAEQVPHARRRAGNKPNHGRDARATKRTGPGYKGKRGQ